MDKTTVIFTGGQKKDVAPMAVLAMNIRDTLPGLADKLVIYHDGIARKDQELIKSIYPTEFRRFRFGVSFIAYRKNTSLRYFSPMVFCKYECFSLLNEYDRVIWTDYDVIINSDLKELKEESRGPLQLIRWDGILRDKFKGNIPAELTEKYDMEAHTAVNTPILVLTRDIGDYGAYYRWCMEHTRKYAANLNMPEECIFSLLIQEFKLPVYGLEKDRYALHYKGGDEHADIDHAVGQPKFWNGLHHDRWQAYYEDWLDMGGKPYRKTAIERSNEIRGRISEGLKLNR